MASEQEHGPSAEAMAIAAKALPIQLQPRMSLPVAFERDRLASTIDALVAERVAEAVGAEREKATEIARVLLAELAAQRYASMEILLKALTDANAAIRARSQA